MAVCGFYTAYPLWLPHHLQHFPWPDQNKWFAVLLPMMPVASVIYFFIAPDSASFLLLILSILYFIPLCFINGINLLWLEHQSSVNGPIAKAKDHPYGDQVMFLI